MPIHVTCDSCHSNFNAPDGTGGKRAKCPSCGSVIVIPTPPPKEEEVFEAEMAPAGGFDDDDFEIEAPVETPSTDEPRKPCPMCGEQISINAIKCRFCGEIFDPQLKKQARISSSGEDEQLGVFEWIIAILCSNIGCIVAIVYIIQGKPKGKKMLMVVACVYVITFIIGVIIGVFQEVQNAP
ncbi:hypothetical protein Mal64_26930 [Pseudobythopirellula maris]|uniref:Double zinc ribbon n=1 Tax=Pseudobythopirellula maris TaxID=2527991 RepID=A0A5C5ZIZ7_9BACT|nr:hypothetical protein [Pseudobythopirellula maris]TWT87158.1 hypothetical protein Mal64_26930 [Pseudobythopirellula maris]